MRITKNIFTDLAIFMIGFGLVVGIVFPFFMLVMKIPSSYILTTQFVLSCIIAGVIVSAINIILAKSIVGKKVHTLSQKMAYIGQKIVSAKSIGDLKECNSEECRIEDDSVDELGKSARSFNTLLEALNDAISSESAVRDFNTLMASQLELEMLAKNGVNAILGYLKAEGGCIIIERGGEFTIPYSIGLTQEQSILENENLFKYFESKTIQRVTLDETLKLDTLIATFKPQDVIMVPLTYKEVPLGLLLIASSKVIADRLVESVELFSQSFVIALNNAITYSQLQKLAANDPLTGLYNRRFGLNRLSEEYSRAIRSQLPLGVLMFDIDHFKKVNDTYGHTVGDRVLVNIAKIATMAGRKGDFVIRYGGEEFIMILPGAGKEDLMFIGERLRHMVEESVVQVGTNQIKVTISIGLVSYPVYGVESEYDLTEAADQALYNAKERGRNMVVYAT
ncbi:MAG: GGDEF domain-containing protein [Sphaerochaetaceae bacterium]|jgi:two-component system cell cycle response regulator